MGGKRAWFVAGFGLAFLVAARANAEPRTHDGFQFRGTLGGGYLSDSEKVGGTSISDTIHGVAGTSEFYVGGTLPPSLSLGGFLSVVVAPGPSVTFSGQTFATNSNLNLNLVTIGPYIDYYFDPHEGFHVLGTAGFAELNVSNGSASSNAATGFSVGAGVGYDWWVSSEWSLGVLARFQYAHMTYTEFNLSSSENTIAPTVAFSFVYQ